MDRQAMEITCIAADDKELVSVGTICVGGMYLFNNQRVFY